MRHLEKLAYGFTHDGQRLRIVLDAGKGNVIDTELSTELAETLRTQADERHLKCITLEAAGPHFSFGASVPEHTRDHASALLERFHAVIFHLIELDIPTVASVRGSCLGGGLEVVLPCQRVIVSPTAKMGQPEIVLGMFAPAGSVLLPERIGRAAAEDLLLTGRIVGAEEALAMRLADEVADDPEAAAVAWFEKHLLGKSAMAIRFATRAARESLRPRVHRALSRLEHLFVEHVTPTHDAREGIASFIEKRPPNWADR